ncbi:MAG TPA: ATP phosphoribosyltransferase regulatory subunit [Kofleriaceae bacterium]|nr:ATP phosphoribosyltransferase regulatory subunit [Kofleriaceae bacterium]
MSGSPIRLPSGVRDFLPRAASRRVSLAARIAGVFEAWGYARIITPVFECADVLERGLGHDARAAAIRFVEPGTGEVVALRPDITAQVARLVATRLAEHEGPVRLCYEGAVYRLSGRLADELGQREILQAGIELIEAAEPAGDAEALAVAAAALAAAELPEARLDVGHVAPVRFVLEAITDEDARAALTQALARKDRGRLRAVASSLPPAIAPLAEALGGLWGPADATLARARTLAWPADVRAALDTLGAVLAAFAELADPPIPSLTIDLGDVRGFDYYTGVRFAGYVGGAPDAVLRGGRYDALIGRYGHPARATGFALDVEALAQAQRIGDVAAPAKPPGIAVAGPAAAAVARSLRARGLRAVACASLPTASWLASAGLDAAVATDTATLVRVDDSREQLASPLQLDELVAAVPGKEARRCQS